MKDTDKNSILIVDDEADNIFALMNILNSEYTIYAAKNGETAIALANKHLPDLILLDVLMPEMNGYEVLYVLKNTKETRDIPIIFVTGLGNAEDEEKGLALGAADYIPKPFTPAIVRLRVQNQLKIVNDTRTIVNRTNALDEQLQQQALMVKISNNFLTDTYGDLLYADTLRMVGEFMDIATVLLYKLEDDGSTLLCRSEWVKAELNLETRINDRIELKEPIISVINSLLAANEGDLYIHSNDLPLRGLFKPHGERFNNYIAAPIFVKGEMRAVIVFSRENEEEEWSKSETGLAILVSSVFSSVFERDAMERQFSIVEHSPNLNLYITETAAVEYVNPAVAAVTGYTKSELITEGLGVIFGEKTLTDITEKHIPSARRGEKVMFETDVTRRDGEKRILMVSIYKTVKNNFGVITSDLTEIRELEAGLIAAKEHAEHSSRAKSEFLSRMSHEMLTPMNAIMGMMQIVKKRGTPDNIKGNIEKIDTASRHLLDLINDVLDVSGMEYGMFKLSDAAFDVDAMFQKILQTANYNASAKQQTLISNIDPAMPASLTGDEKRLMQVIANLLANAVKYTPEQGEICFSARVLNEDDGEITLQFEVSDNGIGISKEQQDNLFEIFEQVDGGNTRKHGGIGIGLALSMRVVKMMGGDIWVESESGKGAKFVFTCKLQKD